MLNFPAYVSRAMTAAKSKFEDKPQQNRFIKTAMQEYLEQKGLLFTSRNAQLLRTKDTALHLLLKAGFVNCAELLISEYNANPLLKNALDETAVSLIIRNRESELLACILKKYNIFIEQNNYLWLACYELKNSYSSKAVSDSLEMVVGLMERDVKNNNMALYSTLRKVLKAEKLRQSENSDLVSFIDKALMLVELKFPQAQETKIEKAAYTLRMQYR